MNSKDIDLIKEMLQMQEKLDETIMEEYGLEEIEEEKLNMAILDEIGELTHELKANWCWWKKSQEPVDRNKVLEELADLVSNFDMDLKDVKKAIDDLKREIKAYDCK